MSESELEAIVKAGQTLMLPPEVRTPLRSYFRMYVWTCAHTCSQFLFRFTHKHSRTNLQMHIFRGEHRSIILLFYLILCKCDCLISVINLLVCHHVLLCLTDDNPFVWMPSLLNIIPLFRLLHHSILPSLTIIFIFYLSSICILISHYI